MVGGGGGAWGVEGGCYGSGWGWWNVEVFQVRCSGRPLQRGEPGGRRHSRKCSNNVRQGLVCERVLMKLEKWQSYPSPITPPPPSLSNPTPTPATPHPSRPLKGVTRGVPHWIYGVRVSGIWLDGILVEYCFTSTETVGLLGTGSPGHPPRLSHSS